MTRQSATATVAITRLRRLGHPMPLNVALAQAGRLPSRSTLLPRPPSQMCDPVSVQGRENSGSRLLELAPQRFEALTDLLGGVDIPCPRGVAGDGPKVFS